MDTSLFTEKKTGQLIQIDVLGDKDYAFVPDNLPPELQFPLEMWPKLSSAKEYLGKLDGIGRTLPDNRLLLSPLSRREAVTSSRIEGTYATEQELILFELNPREPKSKDDQVNAWIEVYNYSAALQLGIKRLRQIPFSLNLIKQLHERLLRGVRGQQTNPGEFRRTQVAIGSSRRFIPPPVDRLNQVLYDCESYINIGPDDFDPLIRAFVAHYQFEAIHPFRDGNGRIGRVLLSLMISKWCNHYLPWLYLSPYFEKHRDEYVQRMFEVSSNGAWNEWFDFCLTGTIQQAEDAISRCEKLNELQAIMLDRIRDASSPRVHQIVYDLFSSPMVQIAELKTRFNVTYPTAKADVEYLEKVGILRELNDTSPRSHYAPEIFHIAFHSPDSI